MSNAKKKDINAMKEAMIKTAEGEINHKKPNKTGKKTAAM